MLKQIKLNFRFRKLTELEHEPLKTEMDGLQVPIELSPVTIHYNGNY